MGHAVRPRHCHRPQLGLGNHGSGRCAPCLRTPDQRHVAQPDEALAEPELLWRNVLSATEDAMQDQPPRPCGTPTASLLTMVVATTSTLLPASA